MKEVEAMGKVVRSRGETNQKPVDPFDYEDFDEPILIDLRKKSKHRGRLTINPKIWITTHKG